MFLLFYFMIYLFDFFGFSEFVRGGEGVGDEASAVFLQIQEDLFFVRVRLDSLELEKRLLVGQLRNCCRNDSFYIVLVQDRINLILGQVGVSLIGKFYYYIGFLFFLNFIQKMIQDIIFSYLIICDLKEIIKIRLS